MIREDHVKRVDAPCMFHRDQPRQIPRGANKGNNSGTHVKPPLADDVFRMHDSKHGEKGAINSCNYPWTDEARVTGG